MEGFLICVLPDICCIACPQVLPGCARHIFNGHSKRSCHMPAHHAESAVCLTLTDPCLCRVPTLDNDMPITVQPGSQEGTQLRIYGQGIRRLRSSGRGDMVVHLRAVLPRKVTQRQRQLLLDFADEDRQRRTA